MKNRHLAEQLGSQEIIEVLDSVAVNPGEAIRRCVIPLILFAKARAPSLKKDTVNARLFYSVSCDMARGYVGKNIMAMKREFSSTVALSRPPMLTAAAAVSDELGRDRVASVWTVERLGHICAEVRGRNANGRDCGLDRDSPSHS